MNQDKLGICYITRKEHFNAAHRLYVPEWTDAQNFEMFGKCANKNGHGHNFTLFVTVKGIPDPVTGFIIDLKVLSELIKDKIIDRLDHNNLNMDVDFLQDIMPSIENLVMVIWQQLKPHIHGGELHCIKLIETDNNFVEYYGE